MHPQSTRLENLVQYVNIAASTAKSMADYAPVPFLGVAATLALSIANSAEAMRLNTEHRVQILEQIHEIFCSIMFLSSTQTDGVLPPTLLHDIAEFTESLQKLYAFLRSQQGMSKFKLLLKQSDRSSRLDVCKSELQRSLHVFKVRVGVSSVKGQVEMHRDAEMRHKELLELLADHRELTESCSSTSVVGSFGDSTGSLSLLPPSPQIFHGRESELEDIVNLLMQQYPRIAILGPGGIGKTSLAAAVLHQTQVVQEFPRRYFVACHSTSTCSELVSSIASHIGLEKSANLVRKLTCFLSDGPKSLLLLDNFETPWEPDSSRAEVEEFLSLLADVSNVAIVITMRGAERPGKVPWSHPFLGPLRPLPHSASLQTFIDIAGSNHHEEDMRKVLELTSNLPLAVSLIANIAAYEGCEATLERWDTESTRLISDGCDGRSSLEVSIMLSFSSSRMTPEAQDLLGVLSTLLPDGISDADLVQAALPIPNVLAAKSTLLRTAMAYTGSDRHLKVLTPIAEHIRTVHPPSPELKYTLRKHFHEILNLWKNFDELLPTGVISQITDNFGNLNTVLKDALRTKCPDTVQIFSSVTSLDDFCFRTNRVSSPLMVVVAKNIEDWQNHAVYGEYLIHKLGHSVYSPVMDGEAQIAMGTRYFDHQAQMDRAKWYNGVGIYYRMHCNDICRALDSHHVALTLADGVQRPSLVGRKALTNLSMILSKTGSHIEAQKYARQAQEYAEILGNITGQAYAFCIEAKCLMALSDFRYAANLCRRSRNLLESSGLQGGTLDIFVQQQEAEIHLLKTEYHEARHIHETTINSIPAGQPPTYSAVLSHLNLALIYIATEASSETVNKHLDISRHHFNTTFAYPTGGLYCDMALADLYLHTGEPIAARVLLQECYASARGKLEEGATFCLERLADLSHGLNDESTTAHWANVYLGSALQSKDSLATMKAIKCFGEIFFSNGDNETALNLFTVALDGFTNMDIHRWKATCMIRIADILAARGEFSKSGELWTSGRVLLARCSQVTEMALVDARLETLNLHQRMY
ncbi:hypothetical protein K438DRAFT_1762315 [Mycena galopus ATCC 62051]|nr:hypothetical protein K438DRAFT_1762315 [Mycena galopus ATCC 62051]